MTETFKRGMLATIGGGIKLSQYTVENPGTDGATINAKDIGLSTIYSLQLSKLSKSPYVDVEYTAQIGTFTPGKGDANYATVRSSNAAAGTELLGTVQVFAIGI